MGIIGVEFAERILWSGVRGVDVDSLEWSLRCGLLAWSLYSLEWSSRCGFFGVEFVVWILWRGVRGADSSNIGYIMAVVYKAGEGGGGRRPALLTN